MMLVKEMGNVSSDYPEGYLVIYTAVLSATCSIGKLHVKPNLFCGRELVIQFAMISAYI